MPSIIRLLFLVLSLVLTALIVWAIRTGDFFGAGDFLLKQPWGLVTIFDLYFGFIIVAVVIGWTERKWLPSVFWITPLFVLGNVWAGVWLILRGGKLYTALTRGQTNAPKDA